MNYDEKHEWMLGGLKKVSGSEHSNEHEVLWYWKRVRLTILIATRRPLRRPRLQSAIYT